MEWYPVSYGFRRSSVPTHLTAWNGLNFSRSVGNPSSRLERVREYLRVNGPRTKREILRDVFGKSIVEYDTYLHVWNYGLPNVVTRGWGTYLFGYGVRHGFFKKERKGNITYWSVV